MHEIMDKKLVKLIKRFNLFMFWLPSSGQFYTYMKPKGDRDSCFLLVLSWARDYRRNGASSYWEESNVAKCNRWKCLQQLIIYLKDRMLADSKKECLKFLAISMETQEEVIMDHDHTSRDMELAKRPFSYFPLTQKCLLRRRNFHW